MAAVSLNSNLAALRAKRALNASSAELSSTLERLSTGKRINQASDDAAGLAVASTLNATARVHNQAARNVNDGISFLNVADGAVQALKDILFRLRELSTQSSNGTFSNAQRQSIDKESQALVQEYNRTVQTTAFNGQTIFTSNRTLTVQAGYGSTGTITAVLGVSSSGLSANGSFQSAQAFSTGSGPKGVATADFNRDGKLDIVATDNNVSTVSVLLGNGDGAFQVRQSFATAASPYKVASADLNGDGKPDIVAAPVGSNSISVLLGNGDGTFQAQQSCPTVGVGMDVAILDLNSDGKPDLVSTNDNIDVFIGNGNGTFQGRTLLGAATGYFSVSGADINGDGKVDLVASDGSGYVDTLLGNGNGTFQALAQHPGGGGLRFATATDVNNDGRDDIVSTEVTGNTVGVQLGNGDGTFQSLQSFATGVNPRMVTVTDLSGDGLPDLAVSEADSNTVGILLGNGDGTFRARQAHAVGTSPYQVTAGDFNGDGVVDLITADSASSTASVLLGNGHTTSVTVGIRPIGGISLATQQNALDAQGTIDGYLDNVNQVSGTIGTALSRFQIAAHVASSVADVSQAAEARITDADTADNTAALLRSKILQQASAAVLAQANQQPALALTLLRE